MVVVGVVHLARQRLAELVVAALLELSFFRCIEGSSFPSSPPRELFVAVSGQFALGWVVGHWEAGN